MCRTKLTKKDMECPSVKGSFSITENGSVIMQKALPFDREYLRSLNNTLTEWISEEDDEAFKDLKNL